MGDGWAQGKEGEGSEPEREMVEALAGSLYEKSSVFSERGDKGENVGRGED